ncbi:MAG: hypothetical protein ACTSUE_09745 [Promethearchaeota archaeon]
MKIPLIENVLRMAIQLFKGKIFHLHDFKGKDAQHAVKRLSKRAKQLESIDQVKTARALMKSN